jgi:hypothetical protein
MRTQWAQADGSAGASLVRLTRRVAPLVTPYAKRLVVLLALVVVSPAVHAAQIWLLGVLVDDVAASGRIELLGYFSLA